MLLIAKTLSLLFVFLLFGLWAVSEIIARNMESRFPPAGEFFERNGAPVHYFETRNSNMPENGTVVFIHGASSNLNDQRAAFEGLLKEDLRLVFVDRPGHGYSAPFEGSNSPVEQANLVADLMGHLGIEKAVIVGHSFGAVVASAVAVLHPDKAGGLVFIAPVSHSWPTGVDWYYALSDIPVIGWLFTRTIAVPAGYLRYKSALRSVFSPNPVPVEYEQASATRLVLRPENFHENAKDVARLIDHVELFSQRYREITAPTVIVTGEADDIVSNSIHAHGLKSDIPHAKRIDLPDVGHKPDFAAGTLIANAIAELAIHGTTGQTGRRY